MLQNFKNIQYLEKVSSNPNAPILILLHGYGSNEEDLFGFSADFSRFHIISLRGLRQTPMGGFSWYDLDLIDGEMQSNQEQAKESLQKIEAFITGLPGLLNKKEAKIWLCGFSQGAILTYAVSLNQVVRINRAICLSGFPDDRLFDGLDKTYEDLAFFVSHGKNDVVLPVEWAKRAEPLLQSKSIPFFYKEYGSGHNLNPENYKDLLHWVEENS